MWKSAHAPSTSAAATYGTLKIGACEIVRTISMRRDIPDRRIAQKRRAGPPSPVGTTAKPPSSPTATCVERVLRRRIGSRENTAWKSAE